MHLINIIIQYLITYATFYTPTKTEKPKSDWPLFLQQFVLLRNRRTSYHGQAAVNYWKQNEKWELRFFLSIAFIAM